MTVGDPILYTLSLEYDSTLRLVVPAVGKTLGKLDILGDTTLPEGRSASGRKIYRRQLRLSAFDVGRLWISSLHGELVAPGEQSIPWHSDSLAVTVASVLQAAGPDTADIRGLKGPYEVPVLRWWLWLIVGVVVLAVATTYWFLKRRRRAEIALVTPPIPPWQQALQSLQSMRGQIDPSTDGGRLWYFRLSEILRRYFDDRFGWDSIDETTSEVMDRLAAAPFNGDHRERAREFFLLSDQVRYARHPSKLGRPELDWGWVHEFVQATIPVAITAGSPVPVTEPSPPYVTTVAAQQEAAK